MPFKQKKHLREQAILRADAFRKVQKEEAEQKAVLKAIEGMSGDVCLSGLRLTKVQLPSYHPHLTSISHALLQGASRSHARSPRPTHRSKVRCHDGLDCSFLTSI